MRDLGFKINDDEIEPHRASYNVVDTKDKASLITTLVDRRANGQE